MSLITNMCNQRAVYWGDPEKDGYGKLTFTAPVEIAVRWESKQELFINQEGKEERSQAKVWAPTAFAMEGYLFLGGLDDLSSAEKADPQVLASAFMIKGSSNIPDINGNEFVQKVWM